MSTTPFSWFHSSEPGFGFEISFVASKARFHPPFISFVSGILHNGPISQLTSASDRCSCMCYLSDISATSTLKSASCIMVCLVCTLLSALRADSFLAGPCFFSFPSCSSYLFPLPVCLAFFRRLSWSSAKILISCMRSVALSVLFFVRVPDIFFLFVAIVPPGVFLY